MKIELSTEELLGNPNISNFIKNSEKRLKVYLQTGKLATRTKDYILSDLKQYYNVVQYLPGNRWNKAVWKIDDKKNTPDLKIDKRGKYDRITLDDPEFLLFYLWFHHITEETLNEKSFTKREMLYQAKFYSVKISDKQTRKTLFDIVQNISQAINIYVTEGYYMVRIL